MPIKTKDFSLENQIIYIFKDKDILVKKTDHTILPDLKLYNFLKDNDFYRITFQDTCTSTVTAEIKNDGEVPFTEAALSDYELIPVRQYFYESDSKKAALSARLKTYVNWLTDNKFCCSCGSPLELYETENALFCPKCHKVHYPRIEPCIIVLVHKDDKVLMLRHTYRNQDKFVCLAGFMEAGETVEQCVKREVKEEVGIEIDNLRYMGSQGWPFPDQLMLAFYADYKSGELKLQESEIAEAQWLDPKTMENPPFPGSVAWRLITNKFDDC